MTEPTAVSSARWMRRPPSNSPSYTAVARQSAAATTVVQRSGLGPMTESSSTPPAGGSEPPEPTPKPNVIRKPGRPKLRIHGEPFYVEHDADTYYIMHDKWSLVGAGDSLAAAYKDFLKEAEEVAPVYTNTPASQLDYEGSRLAKFLFRFR